MRNLKQPRSMIDKILLAPYYLALKTRHLMYDCGLLKVRTADVPTICLGNITVGGTGKTPHAEMILHLLQEDEFWGQKNLAVLSRGYKRTSKRFQQVPAGGSAKFYGDEPQQIKNKFPEVTVAVEGNRVRGCSYLSDPSRLASSRRDRKCKDKDFPASDLIILDDAFQHRALKAKVNIVLVDYTRPVHKDCLIPFGSLRDLPSRMSAADIIIVSKCPSYLDEWERTKWANSLGIRNFNPGTGEGVGKKGKAQNLFFTTISYCPPEPIFEEGDPRYVYAKRLVLFSGIANDKPLKMYLSDAYKVVRHLDFPDHHKFTPADIRSIQSAANAFPTSILVTTEKDSQRVIECKKIPEDLRQRMFYVPIKVTFLNESEKQIFRSKLLELL